MPDRDSNVVLAAQRTWQALTLPGVSLSLLREHDGERTLLLRMEPGAAFPLHRHSAGEQLYVLAGSVEVGSSALVAGDYLYTRAGAEHAVSSAHGCVLFITTPSPIEIVAPPVESLAR